MADVALLPQSIMGIHETDQVTLEGIKNAAQRIRPHVHQTPILTCEYFNQLAGRKLYFKCENLQKTGSFKVRGATNALLRLKEEKGHASFTVVTHSSGNHAQALAYASTQQGVSNRIVMPSNAPVVKKQATKGYGGNVVECEPTEEVRVQTATEILSKLGNNGEYISPSDHPFIIEGQGTMGLEMLEQVPDLHAAIVCCSKGGFLSGVAAACKQTNSNIKVFGAEPVLADDTARSLKANKRIVLTEFPKTIADGLRMSVGVHTWPIIRDNVTDVITVTEDEIVRAMFLLWERMKLVVEPSGAVPFAAVLTEQFKALPKEIQNVGVAVSGGNIDLHRVPWMTNPEKYDLAL